jgi:hypothetical protein
MKTVAEKTIAINEAIGFEVLYLPVLAQSMKAVAVSLLRGRLLFETTR